VARLPDLVSALFGVKVPDNFLGETPLEDANAQAVEPISWYYPHVFHSYPKGFPRMTFQDPVIGDGLYYTSGMESFISTMETNALMGKNVARLIVDSILGGDTGEAVFGQNIDEDRGQSLLQEL
jgi:prenylcysteine oxidase/farnesylcysteine lyase